MRFRGRLERGILNADPVPERHEGCEVLCRGTASAAEIARAWRQDGPEFPSRLLGEYAAVLFDGRELTLAHDGLGLLPLFYAPTRDGIEFASHLEDLDPGELDEEYLADHLATGTQMGERTPFQRVRRLLPGRTMVWSDGRLRERRAWDLSQVRPIRLAEYAGPFRDILAQAVASSARADGPVWADLSGGLDSSTIVCLAAPRGIEAVSVVFSRSKEVDDAHWMEEVLKLHPIPWHRIDGDAALPYTELPDRYCAEPYFAMTNWGWRRMYEEAMSAAGARVLLTGMGGDQTLFGDGPEPLHISGWRELKAWRAADPTKRSLLFWILRTIVRPRIAHWLGRSPTRKPAPVPPWIRPEYAKRAALADRIAKPAAPRCRSVADQNYADRVYGIASAMAIRAQVPRSFEYRNPLLDRRIIEFLFAAPWDEKLRPDGDRRLHRLAMQGILPEPIRLRRTKQGTSLPYTEGLRRGKAWTDALTNAPHLERMGIVDGALWREEVAQARMGRTFWLPSFVAAATLEIWLRQLESFKRGLRPPDR